MTAGSWGRRAPMSSASNLTQTLRSPRLAGFRQHRGKLIPSEHIAPILDELTWRRLSAVLDGRRGVQGRANRRLSGLVVCGRCCEKMYVHKRQKGAVSPVYRCMTSPGARNCGKVSVVADALEALVGEALAQAIDTEGLSEAMVRTSGGARQTADVMEEAERVQERLDQLSRDYYGDALIGREEFLAARATLSTRLTALEARLVRVARGSALAGLADTESIRRAWTERPAGWGRELSRALLERVVIAPVGKAAVGFDPARVSLVWRGGE